MNFTMTSPCSDCPFLKKFAHGYPIRRLHQFADNGTFHCHKTGICDEDTSNFEPTKDSQACAGMLIFNEKRERPNQMMRIAERIGSYDRAKLNMKAKVR